ncbi:MAG: hypothetical protein QM736_02290 [Vicinamibacterales bacterium]
MPALLLAVALTFTRMAWVGVCAAAAVLLVVKDFRLLAVAADRRRHHLRGRGSRDHAAT